MIPSDPSSTDWFTDPSPKPAASDAFSWTYFSWSTWEIANNTMNSAISTVIMSE